MGNVVFDDFKKLEIRIGKILCSEKIEGTDKLLKLEVDFGDFKRQIVSGIAEVYSVHDLIGKQCPFIINLEPRIIRGVESQGMIMAADDSGKPILIHPDRKIPEGSVVR